MDGSYADHAGVKTADHHDTVDTVLTSLHETHACWGGCATYVDLVVTKMSEAGVPSPVMFHAYLVAHQKEVDGKNSTYV